MHKIRKNMFLENSDKIIFPALMFLIFSFLFAAFNFTIPWSYKYFFDKVIPYLDFGQFYKLSILIIFMTLLCTIFNFLSNLMKRSVGYNYSKSLRLKLLEKFIRYEYIFFLKTPPGVLINYLIPESDKIAGLVVNFFQVISSILQIAVFFCIIFFLDRQLFIIYLAVSFCSLIWMLFFKNIVIRSNSKLIKVRESMYNLLYEIFPAIKDVKCHSLNGYYKSIYDDMNSNNRKTFMPLTIYSTLMSLGSIAPVMIANLTIIYFSFYKYQKGDITIGMILTLLSFIYTIIYPMNELISSLLSIQNTYASVISMKKVYDGKQENHDGEFQTLINDKIKIMNLDFSYTGEQDNLSGFNLEYRTNDFVVIAGKSGTGKSTIINLIMKLFNVDDGKIFFDDKDINEISHKNVRNSIGIVSQDVFILNDTLRNNIDINKRLSDEEILEICRQSELMQFLENLHNGLDTVLSERGMNLSGGERQRIIIARCLAKKVNFLIMDEATSALDLETEKRILNNLIKIKNEKKHFSLVMITHRPELAKNADMIFFLEDGKISECGTHEELINARGPYYRLFNEK